MAMGTDPSDHDVARDATYYRAPEALRARIRASLAEGARPSRPRWFEDWWRGAGLAAAFATVAAIAWSAGLLQARGAHEDRIVDQLVAAHVRSLMVDAHLSDVASSDQHTVKPWFAGKLDYVPVVADLAAAGFPLVGGRLDYLDGRPVAALAFRRRQHVINVFESPTSAADAAPVTRTVRGYSVVRWTHGGLEFRAISDASAGEVELLARELLKVP